MHCFIEKVVMENEYGISHNVSYLTITIKSEKIPVLFTMLIKENKKQKTKQKTKLLVWFDYKMYGFQSIIKFMTTSS